MLAERLLNYVLSTGYIEVLSYWGLVKSDRATKFIANSDVRSTT